jgi:hypothetical protein
MPLVMNKGEQMNAKKNAQQHEHSVAMMEELESRELYSVTALPAVQCPSDPRPLVGLTQPVQPTRNIIAVLIGL